MGDWEAARRERDERRRAEVMELPVLPVRVHRTLAPVDPGDVLVTASVGPGGDAAALWASPGGGTRITTYRADSESSFTVAGPPVAHPLVQPLSDDRVLVVAARCRWRSTGPDRNAVVYGADGAVLAEGTVGDGVEHVRVSDSGHIWVGYFDEGVYGNRGWGDPGPPPIGARGLVRFTPAFEPDWRFPDDNDHPWGPISDAYALTLDGDTVWACYYTDFPVVRVRNGKVDGWHNTLFHGSRALAVGDTTVALYGGYGPDHDVLVVAGLGQGSLRKLAEYRVVLPDGAPLPAITRAFGHGPDLHLLDDTAWFTLNLYELPASPGS